MKIQQNPQALASPEWKEVLVSKHSNTVSNDDRYTGNSGAADEDMKRINELRLMARKTAEGIAAIDVYVEPCPPKYFIVKMGPSQFREINREFDTSGFTEIITDYDIDKNDIHFKEMASKPKDNTHVISLTTNDVHYEEDGSAMGRTVSEKVTYFAGDPSKPTYEKTEYILTTDNFPAKDIEKKLRDR